MTTLKGQNLRIFAGTSVIGMSTGCTVTLTGNTDDASHKDIVGMAATPTITSKSWSVQVESLNVTDAAAMLTAIKNQTPFTLKWDETSTTDNQTAQHSTLARTGSAFLTDLTLTFNDRENSAKSIQFTGSGPLTSVTGSPATEVIAVGSYTKGQFVRLFLGKTDASTDGPIAAAKQLSLHVSVSLENSTTKDTVGDWQIQEVVGISYDITSNALVSSGETITSTVKANSLNDIEDIYENSLPVAFEIANVSGANNRTKGTVIVSGKVLITSLVLNGPNRANADYTTTLTGYGPYNVAA